MGGISQITIEAMKSDIDEVALQGIEFWSNVCDEEMDLAIEASEVGPCQGCKKSLDHVFLGILNSWFSAHPLGALPALPLCCSRRVGKFPPGGWFWGSPARKEKSRKGF